MGPSASALLHLAVAQQASPCLRHRFSAFASLIAHSFSPTFASHHCVTPTQCFDKSLQPSNWLATFLRTARPGLISTADVLFCSAPSVKKQLTTNRSASPHSFHMVLVVDRTTALGYCTGPLHWIVARWGGALPVCPAVGQDAPSTMMFAEDTVSAPLSPVAAVSHPGGDDKGREGKRDPPLPPSLTDIKIKQERPLLQPPPSMHLSQ